MRRIKVSVTTLDGEVLDIQEGDVRDGVSRLPVFEVLPDCETLSYKNFH